MATVSTTRRVLFELQPVQEEVFYHSARFKVVVAGRRWGKTRLALYLLIRYSLEHPRSRNRTSRRRVHGPKM
jgi:hypothetical protein